MNLKAKTSTPAVKVCGVTTAADVAACGALGAQYVGFNFYPASKRFVSPEAAAGIWEAGAALHRAKSSSELPRPVAVVATVDDKDIDHLLRVFPALAVVQFHLDILPQLGAGPRGRDQALQEITARRRGLLAGRQLWQACAVASVDDIIASSELADFVDLVLYDSPVSKRLGGAPASPNPGSEKIAVAPTSGGAGTPFDWQLLRAGAGANAKGLPKSYGIAGGILPQNLARLARCTAGLTPPALIDVASGVEVRPGIKDQAKVAALLLEVSRLW